MRIPNVADDALGHIKNTRKHEILPLIISQ